MAALEYLTQNSLTSHPFKNSYGLEEGSGAVDDWFYDILFVSYDSAIRRVYIQSIEKKENGNLEIGFNNAETLNRLPDGLVIINTEDVVNHYANKTKSFAGVSKEKFAVKFVLAAGLADKPTFSQTYLPEITELSEDVTVLNTVRVDSINFEAYDGPSLNTVKLYTGEEIALVEPRYNSTFTLTSVSNGDLGVSAGTGAGLYDACPKVGEITDVYTLGEASPNPEGTLFLSATACHSINALTANDELLYGNQLDPYRAFTSPGNTEPFDAVNPNHSLTVENFCSPKCPHENIRATAYYINRITDGASELSQIALRNKETRGAGSGEAAEFHVHDADFCDAAADIFVQCAPGSATHVPCNQGFVQYLHEGRTLQVSYDGNTITSYKIISVINENTLLLDAPLTASSGKIPFRVADNGVFSNINCASSLYNLLNAENLKPYFKVRYSTSEAFNADFEYVTYAAISLGLFNPGEDPVRLNVAFNSNGLGQQGSFKVRTRTSINTTSSGVIDLGCRDFAFLEAIYYIKCGQPASNFSITVKDITDGGDQTLGGGPYTLPPLVGVSCPGDVAGATNYIQITKNETATFSQVIGVDPLVQAAQIYGQPPDWLAITFQKATGGQTTGSLTLTGTKIATDINNATYNLYVRYTGIAIPVVSQVIIQYVASPLFLFPTSVYYTQEKPLVIDPLIVYTDNNPLVQLTAKNMDKPLGWNGSSFSSYAVAIDSRLPEGFSLNTTTGKITGKLTESVPDQGYWDILVTATNPADVVTQQFYAGVSKRAIPVISFLQTLPTTINNYVTYTLESPLCSFKATNDPILLYQTPDKFPSGLKMDVLTGVVYGRITETVSGSKTIRVYARNFYGKSASPLDVTIAYTIYKKPEIQFPEKLARFNGEDGSSLQEPLLTVVATQAYGELNNFDPLLTNETRNQYTAANLPPGFSIDLHTGKVYGNLDTSEGFYRSYAVKLIASNLVASTFTQIYITFPNVKLPIITNLTNGTIFKAVRNLEYVENINPLVSVYAIYLNPTIAATGLPAGLTCLPSGQVVGTVNSALNAGDYEVSFRAQNRYGVSTPAVTCIFRLNVELIAPVSGSVIDLALNRSIVPRPVTVTAGVVSTVTVTNLPAGLTYEGGYIIGTPSEIGSFKSYITVSAGAYGTSRATININVSIPTYKITGSVTNSDTTPAQAIYVTATNIDTNVANTVYVATSGIYEIPGILPGSYNVTVNKLRYETTPTVRNVVISEGDVSVAAFTITGPYKLLGGKVLSTTDSSPLEGVAIATAGRTVYTDVNGRFFINVLQNNSVTLTADIESYVFNPKTITVPAGADDFGGLLFRASPAYNITGSIVAKNITRPQNIGIALYNETTKEKYYDTAIDGYISLQAVAGKYKIIFNPPESNHYNPLWLFKPVELPIEISQSSVSLSTQVAIFQGRSITGRVIAPIHETEIGLPIPVSDVAVTAGNIVLNTTELIWTELDTNTPPAIETKLKTMQAAAASTENIPAATNTSANFFSLRGLVAGQLIVDGYSTEVGSVILLKDQFYPELNGIYTVVDPGSTTANFTIVRSTEANSETALPIGTAIYVTGGVLNTAKTYYLTTSQQITAITDIDGNFTLSNLFPDIYALYVYKPGVGMLSKPTVDVITSNASNAVIRPNTYQVTGKIKHRPYLQIVEPVPLPDVRISLYRASDLFLLKKSEKSKEDGTWIFRSVPDGNYVLKADLRGMTSTVIEHKITVDDGDVNLINFEVYVSTFSPPSVPEVLNVEGGYRALTITIQEATTDLGPEVRYYQYTLDSGISWLTAQLTEDNKITITDLSAYTETVFKLRAVSLFATSAETIELRGTAFDRPSNPEILNIEQKDKELLVYFKEPASDGGMYIDNYAFSTDGGETFTSLTPANSTSPLAISKRSNNLLNLVNGVIYSVAIRAMSGTVAGIASVPVNAFPVAPPESPRLRSVTGGTAGELTIEFDPPEIKNGADVTNYAYSINSAPFVLLNTTQSPANITNLTNGISYNVVIAAVNSEGVGQPSNTLSSRVGTVPGAPAILKSMHADGGKLKLYVTPPTYYGHSPITSYVYYIDSPEGGTENSGVSLILDALDADDATIIYRKLSGQGGDTGTLFQDNKTYTVGIAAVNEFGVGTISEKMEFFAIYTTPNKLIINSYVVENDRIIFNLSFEDNDTGGAGGYVGIQANAVDPLDPENAIYKNEIYYDVFNRTEYILTLTGLTPEVEYTITFSTYNGAGPGAV